MIPAIRSYRILRESHLILKENTGNRWSVEAVFQPEIFRIFSGGFLLTSCAFRQEPGGKHWKNRKNFRPEYCFHKITGINRNRPFPGRTVRPGNKMPKNVCVNLIFIINFECTICYTFLR